MYREHSRPAQPAAPLSAPVGHFLRQTTSCQPWDSINRAVSEMRKNGGILPIASEGKLIGVVNESAVGLALINGLDLNQPCTDILVQPITIAPYASGAEALRLLADSGANSLVVVDDNGRVMGLLRPSDLYPHKRPLPRPEPVGGMATPFGVYLTSGSLSGGVSIYAVVATGACMYFMFAISVVVACWILSPLDKTSASEPLKDYIAGGFSILLFLLFMRLAPLSGTHGAEHMVVHAMERGEELTPEVVSRMPRVHPRCGTNLAVGLSLFVTICMTEWTSDFSVRALVAAIVTLYLWKPLGSFAQQYITTKKPTDKQLRSGIKAGNELIERYATAHQSTAGIPTRLWNSGLSQVMLGSSLAYGVVQGAINLFHLKLPGL